MPIPHLIIFIFVVDASSSVLGRGNQHSKYPGNQRFYEMIDAYMPMYDSAVRYLLRLLLPLGLSGRLLIFRFQPHMQTSKFLKSEVVRAIWQRYVNECHVTWR